MKPYYGFKPYTSLDGKIFENNLTELLQHEETLLEKNNFDIIHRYRNIPSLAKYTKIGTTTFTGESVKITVECKKQSPTKECTKYEIRPLRKLTPQLEEIFLEEGRLLAKRHKKKLTILFNTSPTYEDNKQNIHQTKKA